MAAGTVPPAPAGRRAAAARRCAGRVLWRVFEQGAYCDRALHAEAGGLDARDRALATALSFGAVQRCATLDHLITQFAERPVTALDAHVRNALRLGLYELLFLDGAPDRAVVSDAVTLAKTAGRGGHGLVNAVLRRATREGPGVIASLSDETPEGAAVRHSHPLWLARMWFDALGPVQARALMAADNLPGELALRANLLVCDVERLAAALDVRTHRDPHLDEALIVDGPLDAHGTPQWREGAYMPQSRGAMLVGRALSPVAGERVLDLCAAPGGKTTHLSALMQARGELVAVERHPGRAAALRRTCQRLRAENVRVEVADAALLRPEGACYDGVLVDPPCSGLGTLQARADLRWRASPSSIVGMAAEQRALLAAAAAAVRPGGRLVYSTCTLTTEENEGQVAAFLNDRPEFAVEDLGGELPAFAAPAGPGFLTTFPNRHATAGFFVARLRRAG